MNGHETRQPTVSEIAQLRAATLYAYQAGEPDLDEVTSPWLRHVLTQDDGGMIEVIDALGAMAAELHTLRALVREFTHDDDGCFYDHHGGCQAHGYTEPEPGQRCPHAVAKELIAVWDSEPTSDR